VPSFDRGRVEALLRLAGERLEGEWLLVGGAAAAAWFAPGRTTEDLDLVGLAGTQAERFSLMELAAEAAIPIEAVNSAADFFVRRISDWRDQLIELHRGSRATIFRPTTTLFVLLKLARLTEVDLDDCAALLAHCGATGESEAIDAPRVLASLDALAPTPDAALAARRSALRGMVQRARARGA
jgi:hypothetical protein